MPESRMGHIAKAWTESQRQAAGDVLPGHESRARSLKARSRKSTAAPRSAAKRATRCWSACRSIRQRLREVDRRSEDRRHGNGQDPLRQAADRLRVVPRPGRLRSGEDSVPICFKQTQRHDARKLNTQWILSRRCDQCISRQIHVLHDRCAWPQLHARLSDSSPSQSARSRESSNRDAGRRLHGRHQAAGQGAGRAGAAGREGRLAGAGRPGDRPDRRQRAADAEEGGRVRATTPPYKTWQGRRRDSLSPRPQAAVAKADYEIMEETNRLAEKADHGSRGAPSEAGMGQDGLGDRKVAATIRSWPSTKRYTKQAELEAAELAIDRRDDHRAVRRRRRRDRAQAGRMGQSGRYDSATCSASTRCTSKAPSTKASTIRTSCKAAR